MLIVLATYSPLCLRSLTLCFHTIFAVCGYANPNGLHSSNSAFAILMLLVICPAANYQEPNQMMFSNSDSSHSSGNGSSKIITI